MPDQTEDFEERLRRFGLIKQAPATNVVPINPPTTNGDNGAWVNAAYRNEIQQLARTPRSNRNHTLNITALKLGRLPIDRDELRNQLIQACHANGLIHDDGASGVHATINSAFRKADTDGPRPVPAPSTNGHRQVTEIITPQDAESVHDAIWGERPPLNAATFLFDHDDTQAALWGDGENILWAEGEALMIAGGMGLGKTTLAGQLVRAQLGLDRDVLGLPVTPAGGPILYLAMDRPRQIRRSMLRQFDHTEAEHLANLLIRTGPPIADIAQRPTLLAEMAHAADAAIVYVDSLKDAAIGLSSDEVGAAYNRARQHLLATGAQLCELHHLIKRNPLGGQPSTVADVYGSNWLTAGAGSVVMLTGEPGDPIIEFRHAKQPHAEVGPWRLINDHDRGRFSIDHNTDLLALAAASGPHGLTPQVAATAIFEKEKPSRAQVEKARRRLDKLVTAGKLTRVEGFKGEIGRAHV